MHTTKHDDIDEMRTLIEHEWMMILCIMDGATVLHKWSAGDDARGVDAGRRLMNYKQQLLLDRVMRDENDDEMCSHAGAVHDRFMRAGRYKYK